MKVNRNNGPNPFNISTACLLDLQQKQLIYIDLELINFLIFRISKINCQICVFQIMIFFTLYINSTAHLLHL